MMDDKYVYMYVFIVLYTEFCIFAAFITFHNTVHAVLYFVVDLYMSADKNTTHTCICICICMIMYMYVPYSQIL